MIGTVRRGSATRRGLTRARRDRFHGQRPIVFDDFADRQGDTTRPTRQSKNWPPVRSRPPPSARNCAAERKNVVRTCVLRNAAQIARHLRFRGIGAQSATSPSETILPEGSSLLTLRTCHPLSSAEAKHSTSPRQSQLGHFETGRGMTVRIKTGAEPPRSQAIPARLSDLGIVIDPQSGFVSEDTLGQSSSKMESRDSRRSQVAGELGLEATGSAPKAPRRATSATRSFTLQKASRAQPYDPLARSHHHGWPSRSKNRGRRSDQPRRRSGPSPLTSNQLRGVFSESRTGSLRHASRSESHQVAALRRALRQLHHSSRRLASMPPKLGSDTRGE